MAPKKNPKKRRTQNGQKQKNRNQLIIKPHLGQNQVQNHEQNRKQKQKKRKLKLKKV